MKILYAVAVTAALALNPLLASAGDCVAPGTKTADFDSNGVVNGKDISMLAKNVGKKGTYSASLDLNSDGVLDNLDVNIANKNRGTVTICKATTTTTTFGGGL